jgi:hypothetical protein
MFRDRALGRPLHGAQGTLVGTARWRLTAQIGFSHTAEVGCAVDTPMPNYKPASGAPLSAGRTQLTPRGLLIKLAIAAEAKTLDEIEQRVTLENLYACPTSVKLCCRCSRLICERWRRRYNDCPSGRPAVRIAASSQSVAAPWPAPAGLFARARTARRRWLAQGASMLRRIDPSPLHRLGDRMPSHPVYSLRQQARTVERGMVHRRPARVGEALLTDLRALVRRTSA